MERFHLLKGKMNTQNHPDAETKKYMDVLRPCALSLEDLRQEIDATLLKVSEPARKYYHHFAPFTRCYNIAFHDFDYDQFIMELPLILELAKYGLIADIPVKVRSYADAVRAQTAYSQWVAAGGQADCPHNTDK